MEFSDDALEWHTGVLLNVLHEKGRTFQFWITNQQSAVYIRTTPETFKQEKTARNKLWHLLAEFNSMSSEESAEVGGEIETELRHALENIKKSLNR